MTFSAEAAIALAMAFYVFYIAGLGMLNFRTRLAAVKTGQITPEQMKTFSGEGVSERLLTVGWRRPRLFCCSA